MVVNRIEMHTYMDQGRFSIIYIEVEREREKAIERTGLVAGKEI